MNKQAKYINQVQSVVFNLYEIGLFFTLWHHPSSKELRSVYKVSLFNLSSQQPYDVKIQWSRKVI